MNKNISFIFFMLVLLVSLVLLYSYIFMNCWNFGLTHAINGLNEIDFGTSVWVTSAILLFRSSPYHALNNKN